MYQGVVGHYGVAPSEYWNMTIAEIELIHEAKRSKMIGNIHEDDYIDLLERREKLEAEGFTVL